MLKRNALLLGLFLLSCTQPVTDDQFIMGLETRFSRIQDPEKLRYEVEWAWKELKSRTIPVVHDSHAIFIYRGAAKDVRLAGDFTNWQPGPHLIQLGRSDIFARSMTFPDSARLDYKLIVDGNWQLDSCNAHRMISGFGENSELRMPDYRWPPEIETRPEAPHGTLDTLIVTSGILKNTRSVQVYVPPTYDVNNRYPSLYLHDGSEYINFAKVNLIADNMIQNGSIEPLVMICVPPVSPAERAKEYGNNAKFAEFFVKELVPLVQSRYAVIDDDQHRAICGPSFGGLAALYIGLQAPARFGKVVGQSSHFGHDNGAIFKMVQGADLSNQEFYFHCGAYETGIVYAGKSFVEINREMRDLLASKNANFSYAEYPCGHSWGYWRDELPMILRKLFGKKKPA